MSSGLAVQAGAIILTIIVMGIILGYTGGIGIDLSKTIKPVTVNNVTYDYANKTVDFVNEAGNLGFSLLKFNFLTAIGMVAFAVLGLFMYARTRTGGGV